jgi:hypothetical protein
MKLIDILNEIVTSEKKFLGKGINHKIYPHPTNPDVVYKVGQYHVMYDWVPVFKAHPDLFPKVYGDIKSNMITFKNYFGEKERREASWILVEKLETETFITMFNDLDDYDLGEYTATDIIRYFLHDNRYGEKVMEFERNVKNILPHFYEKCVELFDLITNIWEIVPDADIHMNQFGYDKNGKLKCLDI